MPAFLSPCCSNASDVTDSRPMGDGIRRRRQCRKCSVRFSTWETLGEKHCVSCRAYEERLRAVRAALAEANRLLSTKVR